MPTAWATDSRRFHAQVDRLLPTEQRCLLPHIALRVVTYRQAQPLPPPSQPAALVAATRASLLAVNWLLVQPASDAGDGVAPELDDWVVLQALTPVSYTRLTLPTTPYV